MSSKPARDEYTVVLLPGFGKWGHSPLFDLRWQETRCCHQSCTTFRHLCSWRKQYLRRECSVTQVSLYTGVAFCHLSNMYTWFLTAVVGDCSEKHIQTSIWLATIITEWQCNMQQTPAVMPAVSFREEQSCLIRTYTHTSRWLTLTSRLLPAAIPRFQMHHK